MCLYGRLTTWGTLLMRQGTGSRDLLADLDQGIVEVNLGRLGGPKHAALLDLGQA